MVFMYFSMRDIHTNPYTYNGTSQYGNTELCAALPLILYIFALLGYIKWLIISKSTRKYIPTTQTKKN